MLGFAAIRKPGFPGEHLDRVRWRSLIGEFPELRRIESMTVGGRIYPIPDSAEVIDGDGNPTGVFVWESGQIYVDGPYSMIQLARGIAEILDAYVVDDAGDEIMAVPDDE